MNASGKWKPEDGLAIHAFVSTLGGNAGYAFVEADNPKVTISFVWKFTYWNDVNVVPVVNVGEAFRSMQRRLPGREEPR